MVFVAVAGVLLVSRWSRQDGWRARHVFALAAGATLTYVWTALPAQPEAGGSPTVDLMVDVLFGLIAVVLLPAARSQVTPNTLGSGLHH